MKKKNKFNPVNLENPVKIPFAHKHPPVQKPLEKGEYLKDIPHMAGVLKLAELN